MTDLLKKIGKIVVISMIFLILIATILYFLLLNLHRYKNSSNDSVSINFSENSYTLTIKKPEPQYADTMEEALQINSEYFFSRYPYMNKVSDIIKILENDNYATMFYHVDGGLESDGIVASKFMVMTINEKKQYALILTNPETVGGKWRSKPLITANRSAPLYDLLAQYSINDGERFIFGSFGTDKVNTLKIEGQSPTEIIEYNAKGKKEYFWYYENLISDKPSSQFDIEMDEE